MEIRDVVWIASFPKSGNTWVSMVLQHAGAKYGYPTEFGAYTFEARRSHPPLCVGVVSPAVVEAPCFVLKTHSVFDPDGQPHCFEGVELRTAGFVHIYRNPLDVLLSYINFSRLEVGLAATKGNENYQRRLFNELLGYQEPIGPDEWAATPLEAIPRERLDHALDVYSERGLCIPSIEHMAGSWVENNKSWLGARDIINGRSLRYEDCIEDESQFQVLSDLFTISGKDIDEGLRLGNRVARNRSKEAGGGSIFFNKMQPYYFTEYFSKAALTRFAKENEQVMRQFGYSNVLEMIDVLRA